MTIVTFLLLQSLLWVVCSGLPQGQEVRRGEELHIYSFPTQIGTVAMRTIRDQNGRISKVIYYSLKGGHNRSPYTEAMLQEQSIEIYRYDDQGVQIAREHYAPGMILDFRWDIRHEDHEKRREVKYTKEGVREYEIRYLANRSVSHLYYDKSGNDLIAIRGMIPEDMDLPLGWGEPEAGLACGITLSKAKSAIDDSPILALYVNVKNNGAGTVHSQQLPEAEIELRDSRGAPVKEEAEFAKKRNDPLQKHRYLTGQLLETNETGFVYPAYELDTRYGRLAPGRYTVRVKQRVTEKGLSLISNTIEFAADGTLNR
jgi:hypothetical protein